MLILGFLIATFLSKSYAKNLPNFIGRSADEQVARQFQERGDCSSPSCIFTPGFRRQLRGINDGQLAARLLADILQFRPIEERRDLLATERHTEKRSHGLLDNLLRPPPQAETVALTDRLAEDIMESISRRRRNADPADVDVSDAVRGAAEESLRISRGISEVEMTPPLLARLLAQRTDRGRL